MTQVSNLRLPKFKLSQTMDEAFPVLDPGVRAYGSRVIVQIKSAAVKTEAGIILTTDTVETEHDNTQTAKVVDIGPVAFRNRETLAPWPEGDWAKVGDYVRVPKYAKEQWRRPYGTGGVVFAMVEDMQLLGEVTLDPLDVQAFL